MSEPQALSLEEAKSYIQSTDLSPVVERLTSVDGWSRKKAMQAVAVYRNYLYLLKKYPNGGLPPSYEIDEAWHAHVLYTRKYTKFCQELFGYYQHHDPHSMNQQKEDTQLADKLFEATQEHYKKEFGDYLYQFKKRPLSLRIRFAIKKIFKID